MNPSSVIRAARSATRGATRSSSSQAAQASAGPSSASYPPKKANGRTLPASTLRSLVSLHHNAAGFLHTPQDLTVGFVNAFNHTPEPFYRSYFDYASSIQFNQSLHPAGGMENLVAKAQSADSKGMDFTGRTERTPIYAETVQRTFKQQEQNLWSQQGDSRKGSGRENQYLTDRELQVQEALYGTWERGGVGMDRVEPGLEGVLDFVEAKGKTVAEYAREWQQRDEGASQAKRTEDGQ